MEEFIMLTKKKGFHKTRYLVEKTGYLVCRYPVFAGRVTGRFFKYPDKWVPAFPGTRKTEYPLINTPIK